jgi:hypothetical protein
MREDYRFEVLRSTLSGMEQLSRSTGSSLNRMVKQMVKVPGFRNSALAPVAIKAKNAASAFEKSPAFAATVLAAWVELHPELGSQMHALLSEMGWKILPLEADRSRLPGFMIQWPKENDFDAVYTAFRQKYADSEASDDDLGLMAVWVSGRLPYEMVEKELLFPAGDQPETE